MVAANYVQFISKCKNMTDVCGPFRTNSRLQTGLEGKHVSELGREQHIELLRVTSTFIGCNTLRRNQGANLTYVDSCRDNA